MKDESRNPLAILIDADNVEADCFESIFSEINNYGVPIIRRIYGDWSSGQLQKWQKLFQDYALTQVQVSPNVIHKNATDIALVIDAIDILYQNNVKIFCIISSDSDYTKLALRLRESNTVVIGFGNRKKVNKSFVSSCDRFIYYDLSNDTEKQEKLSMKKLRQNSKLLKSIRSSVDDLREKQHEYINLGTLKNRLIQLIPDFDSRNYGYEKFSELVEAFEYWGLDKKKVNLVIKE